MNFIEAIEYAKNSGMSFDRNGYLVTAGCEGVGAGDWQRINEAADAIAAQPRRVRHAAGLCGPERIDDGVIAVNGYRAD